MHNVEESYYSSFLYTMSTFFLKTLHKLYHIINDMHLYTSKGEALFKASIITISWVGGVNFSSIPEPIPHNIGSAFYLFSLALIMEYIIQLITTKKIWNRLFVFAIIFCSIALLILSSSIMLDKPLKIVSNDSLANLSIIPQACIWLDVITMLLIEPPVTKNTPIESTLKDCGKEEV